MKKTERQNGIVHLLHVRKKMTAHELADLPHIIWSSPDKAELDFVFQDKQGNLIR